MTSSPSYFRCLTIIETFVLLCTLYFTISVSSAPYQPLAVPAGYVPQRYTTGFGSMSPAVLPPGARAIPNKHARQLARKKTRSIMGAPVNPNAVPTVACPKYFAYQYEKKRGGWYGYVALPTDLPSEDEYTYEYTVEINMTINRNVLNSDVIKLNLLSTDDEARTEPYLKWGVKFPYQDLLPKLIELKLNDHVICSDEPEPIPRGGTQVKMWAKSHVVTDVAEPDDNGGEDVNNSEDYGLEDNQPKLGNVLGSILAAVDRYSASFSGGLQGGYNTNVGSLYSTGQIGIGAETSGNLANGFGTNIKSVFDGQTGYGDIGLYGRGSANLGGNITSKGIGWGGTFQGVIAPAG